MDHRIGPHFLRASVGFGGSCFKKDILNLVYLCRHYGLNEVAEYWHQVVKINNYQKSRFAQSIIDGLGGNVKGKKITILGWAFKANTNDSRESPAIDISSKLMEAGALLKIYDPMVSKVQIIRDLKEIKTNKRFSDNLVDKHINQISVFNNIETSIFESDAVGILTDWDQFKKYNWESLKQKNIPVFSYMFR